MIDIVEGKYNLEMIIKNLNIFIKENVALDSIVKKYDVGFKMILEDDV